MGGGEVAVESEVSYRGRDNGEGPMIRRNGNGIP